MEIYTIIVVVVVAINCDNNSNNDNIVIRSTVSAVRSTYKHNKMGSDEKRLANIATIHAASPDDKISICQIAVRPVGKIKFLQTFRNIR